MSVKRKILYLSILVGSMLAGCAAHGPKQVELLNQAFPKDKAAVAKVVEDSPKQKELAAEAALIKKAFDEYKKRHDLLYTIGTSEFRRIGYRCPGGKDDVIRKIATPHAHKYSETFPPFLAEEFFHAEKVLLAMIDKLEALGFHSRAAELRRIIIETRAEDNRKEMLNNLLAGIIGLLSQSSQMDEPSVFSAYYKLMVHMVNVFYAYKQITAPERDESLAFLESVVQKRRGYTGLSIRNLKFDCEFEIPRIYPRD